MWVFSVEDVLETVVGAVSGDLGVVEGDRPSEAVTKDTGLDILFVELAGATASSRPDTD